MREKDCTNEITLEPGESRRKREEKWRKKVVIVNNLFPLTVHFNVSINCSWKTEKGGKIAYRDKPRKPRAPSKDYVKK